MYTRTVVLWAVGITLDPAFRATAGDWLGRGEEDGGGAFTACRTEIAGPPVDDRRGARHEQQPPGRPHRGHCRCVRCGGHGAFAPCGVHWRHHTQGLPPSRRFEVLALCLAGTLATARQRAELSLAFRVTVCGVGCMRYTCGVTRKQPDDVTPVVRMATAPGRSPSGFWLAPRRATQTNAAATSPSGCAGRTASARSCRWTSSAAATCPTSKSAAATRSRRPGARA